MGNCGTKKPETLSRFIKNKIEKADDILWLSHVLCEWVWELDGLRFLDECKDKTYDSLGGDHRNVIDIVYLMKKYRKSRRRVPCTPEEQNRLDEVMKFRKNRGNGLFEIVKLFHIVHGNTLEYLMFRNTLSPEPLF